jgi:pimeloyl-ACP methyl ester carboxylesterase
MQAQPKLVPVGRPCAPHAAVLVLHGGASRGDRRVLIVHGSRDRIASPGRAETVARNLSRSADVEFVRIPEGKHGMLRHGREFDRRAADFTAESVLTRAEPPRTSGAT